MFICDIMEKKKKKMKMNKDDTLLLFVCTCIGGCVFFMFQCGLPVMSDLDNMFYMMSIPIFGIIGLCLLFLLAKKDEKDEKDKV